MTQPDLSSPEYEPSAKRARRAGLLDVLPQEILSHIASFLAPAAFRTFRALCRQTRDTIDLDARLWTHRADAFLEDHSERLSCAEHFAFLARHLTILKAAPKDGMSLANRTVYYDASLTDESLRYFDRYFHEHGMTYGLAFSNMAQLKHLSLQRLCALADVQITDRDILEIPPKLSPVLKSLTLQGIGAASQRYSLSLTTLPSSLQVLNICDNRLASIDVKASLPNLQGLHVRSGGLEMLHGLQLLPKLEEISFGHKEMTRDDVQALPPSLKLFGLFRSTALPSLDHFEHLVEVDLHNVSVVDDILLPRRVDTFFTGMSLSQSSFVERNLPSLLTVQILDLSYSENTSIPSVASMLHGVKTLRCRYAFLERLSGATLPPHVKSIVVTNNEEHLRLEHLEELSELESIDFSHTRIIHYGEPINYPASLTSLNLGSCFVRTMALSRFPIESHRFPKGLQWLNLAKNTLGPLSYTFTCNLQTLNLRDTALRSIDDIIFPDTLVELDLAYTQLDSVDHARWPAGLKELTLAFNCLKSITKVRWPEKLVKLDLANNQLTSLHCESLPSHLESLSFSDNLIASISGGFGRFVCLIHLRLDRNCLSTLEGLILPPFVLRLNLATNHFTILDGLYLPDSTVDLDLSENKIDAFGSARLNPFLRHLNLSSCYIHSLADFTQSEHLRKLSLKGAMCQSIAGARIPKSSGNVACKFSK